MINSVGGASSVNQLYLQQARQSQSANETKAVGRTEKQDSVVLSKRAQAAIAAEHQHKNR